MMRFVHHVKVSDGGDCACDKDDVLEPVTFDLIDERV